jgi:hypothetical protein
MLGLPSLLLSLLLSTGYRRASATIVDNATDTTVPDSFQNIAVDALATEENSAKFGGDVGRYIREAKGPGTLVYNETNITSVSITYFAQNTSFTQGTWQVSLSLGGISVGSVLSKLDIGQRISSTTDEKVLLQNQ